MPLLWLVLGIISLLVGLAMMAGWFDWLLRVGGVILIVVGIVAIIFAAVNMFSGAKRGSGGF